MVKAAEQQAEHGKAAAAKRADFEQKVAEEKAKEIKKDDGNEEDSEEAKLMEEEHGKDGGVEKVLLIKSQVHEVMPILLKRPSTNDDVVEHSAMEKDGKHIAQVINSAGRPPRAKRRRISARLRLPWFGSWWF